MKAKISSQDASALLKRAGAGLRALITENKSLKEKLAFRAKEDRIQKIALEMETKGLNDGLTLEEKVAHLKEAENLDVTEEAIKIAAPQGQGFGDLSDEPGKGTSPFESYILTGEVE